MSYANRKRVYEKLVREGRLGQDDGSLLKEFGNVKVKPKPEPKPEPKKMEKKKDE